MANKRWRHSRQKTSRKKSPKTVAFTIESMDMLGQGVAKIDGKPCFIPKTLPSEQGEATIYRASKGVLFAQLKTLSHTADNRTEPVCEHYEDCGACHFLHTDYESELTYKRGALSGHLRRLDTELPTVNVIPADKRLGYRNRVQLHYRHKYLGTLDAISDNIVEIPHCQIIEPALQAQFDQLYDDKGWAKKSETDVKPSSQGHCELYFSEGNVQLSWNAPYAQGGFSQVNQSMNAKLKALVTEESSRYSPTVVLDLFAGGGNLSNALVENNPNCRRLMVDYDPDRANLDVNISDDFLHLDLYSDTALRTFKNRVSAPNADLLLVDPPRKGFPTLDQWVKLVQPKRLIYVSCNAATLVRDLKSLSCAHTLSTITLLDLFPSTHHFETLVTVDFS